LTRLIINADDFGFTTDVNAGIVDAHRNGVLTSTTLMANGEAFSEAVRLARETPTLDIGCHLVLVQGRSVVSGRAFPERLQDVYIALAKGDIDVYRELRAQIEKILAAGLLPTHLDSHKHTHVVPKVFRAVVRLAHEFGIPNVRLPLDTTLPVPDISRRLLRRYYARLAREYNVRMTDHFIGFRMTGSLTESSFTAALRLLRDGITEFMCHPGYLGSELKSAATRLKESRVLELEALVSPRVRQLMAAESIHLEAFRRAPNPAPQ
jgi:chitin disaccharide deacetylase